MGKGGEGLEEEGLGSHVQVVMTAETAKGNNKDMRISGCFVLIRIWGFPDHAVITHMKKVVHTRSNVDIRAYLSGLDCLH